MPVVSVTEAELALHVTVTILEGQNRRLVHLDRTMLAVLCRSVIDIRLDGLQFFVGCGKRWLLQKVD